MPKERKGAIVACLECGKEEYMPPSQVARHKYCSWTCQSAASEKARRRTCARCGTAFDGIGSTVGKFCSRQCYMDSRDKRTTCAVCSKPLAQSMLRYCSHTCRDEGRRTLEQKPCETCGKPMKVQPHKFESQRFCSHACKNESLRGMLEGPGGRSKRSDGYMQVYYPSHPEVLERIARHVKTPTSRHPNLFVLEHRLVMEQVLGRRLLSTEQVNHINQIRDDNRPENLEVLSAGDHARISNQQGVVKRKSMRDELAEYKLRFGPLS